MSVHARTARLRLRLLACGVVGAALLGTAGVPGCAGTDAGGGVPDAPVLDTTPDAVVDVSGPPQSGPPSACGGLRTGTLLSAASGSPDDDLFQLTGLASGAVHVAFDARDGGVAVLTVNLKDNVRRVAGDNALELDASLGSSDPGVAGEVFADINNRWGGIAREGRVCFDAAVVPGTALTGRYALVVEVLATDVRPAEWYRLTGAFSVPGDAVTADGADLLTGATVLVD